jgi:hypothetical protein
MSSKPTSGLSGISEFCLSSESDHQVVDRGHDFASVTNGHASSIFVEDHVLFQCPSEIGEFSTDVPV